MTTRNKRKPLTRPPLPAIPESRAARPRWLAPVTAVTAMLVVGIAGFLGGREVDGQDSSVAANPTPALAADGTLRQPVHEHSDFAVFIRGEQVTLDEPQFLSDGDTEISANAHIHAPRTNVIHIHREQTTWREFLESLAMSVDDACLGLQNGEEYCTAGDETLKFFVNGVRVDSLRMENLVELGRVLITYGSEDGAALESQIASVTDEACIPSENCKARIDPNNPEVEPCRKSETTCVG